MPKSQEWLKRSIFRYQIKRDIVAQIEKIHKSFFLARLKKHLATSDIRLYQKEIKLKIADVEEI